MQQEHWRWRSDWRAALATQWSVVDIRRRAAEFQAETGVWRCSGTAEPKGRPSLRRLDLYLACANTVFNTFYGLIVILLTLGSDLLFIFISYSLILKAVLGMTSGDEGHRKALGTCVSHLCAVLVFYVPVLGLSVVHRFGRHASPLLHVVMGNIYILLPPLMNPIIYSIKTKQIYSRILRMVSLKRV
ncbi:PREDICTED: olfactory receptor 51V1-like [Gekko japonicus]|uniref:Olfactory receptor 51V1-like n=1 Tax=Gekko japonicus TaxID=146911 RepID=A0ABM1KI59_GEKJA|nr:PREDICTED: olfactory receptor 51V1-like [Gekko japonicus]